MSINAIGDGRSRDASRSEWSYGTWMHPSKELTNDNAVPADPSKFISVIVMGSRLTR